jgi:serine/threonine protein kinase
VSALKICPQCGTEYELDQRFCPKDGSTLKSQGGTTADLVGSIIADRYHVLKKLGEGGMGTVYLAEHVKMGRKSAVKVMNPGTVHDADAISRFNREASNASKINHPNVAAIYDFGETKEGLIYLAMEFVEGPALTKVIEDAGALPPLRAADITRQAAEALAVAHDMGIVHRDLKPDNIMIAKNRDGSDCVKVVDFGIAKAANNDAQKVTKTGLVVGTPEYMSPEQLAGDKLDGRSDTYSLALVSFAMMTGKLPFPADTVQESMILRLTDRPKQLVEMKADIAWPPEVQAVMDKALERDAPARYQTASEFGKALYAAVEVMPESKMTNAFTSVMGRMSTPKKPGPVVPGPVAGPARPSANATRPMPATRVNQVTPPGSMEPPTLIRPEKNRLPMIATAVGVLAVAAVAGVMWVNSPTAGTDNANGAVDSRPTQAAVPQATPTPPVAAPLDVDTELEQIGKLTDLTSGTPAQAAEALLRLDKLPAASGMTADQRVLAALLRAEANINRQNNCTALKAVQDVEGAARGTRYENRVSTILKNATC